jgi:hypothetical protein
MHLSDLAVKLVRPANLLVLLVRVVLLFHKRTIDFTRRFSAFRPGLIRCDLDSRAVYKTISSAVAKSVVLIYQKKKKTVPPMAQTRVVLVTLISSRVLTGRYIRNHPQRLLVDCPSACILRYVHSVPPAALQRFAFSPCLQGNCTDTAPSFAS